MLSHLAWLPAPQADFRARAKAVTADAGGELLALATAALDESQLASLAKAVARLVAAGETPQGFAPLRLGLLGDGTLSLVAPAITGSAVRHGLLIDMVEGGYGMAVQDAADPESAIRAAGLDVALLATDARLLGLDGPVASAGEAEAIVAGALARVRMIVEGLRPSVKSAILVQTVVPPLEPLFGSFDRLVPGSAYAMVDAFNRRLAEWAASGEIVLVDIARLAQSVGYERWHEPRHWHASKLGFAPEMIPIYGDVIARTLAALRGKARKCLVLDLDNTLWGGVIGDDGLEGIKLGQGSAAGEAFLAIQRMALDLRGRGIVLAICSKNEDDAARLPFRQHPDMLIREEHVAVFQANWTDKAANLRVIADTLNIGIDSLVFLDDNPAERAQVRRELPMVAVPELPDEPAYYPRMLAAAGYFEAVAFSDEDRARADFYQANAERIAMQSSASDMETYLASLDMTCRIAPVDGVSRARVAQLINKSNQFNLTTRRYSESEVAAAEEDAGVHAIQIRLLDRFGDNGIISVIVARKGESAWDIDTWLMSCRVLGRRVEQAALAHLAAAARLGGATALTGRYIPSAKNKMVANHYAKLGFAPAGEGADGTTLWRLDLAEYQAPSLPLRVEDSALPLESAA